MAIGLMDALSERAMLYDGSKGFLLMRMGLKGGDCPDMWNIERKDDVLGIHAAYVDAGSDIIQTNTLQGSRHHLEARGLYGKLKEINLEGVRLAKKAAGAKALVAASIGPTGKLMAPFGDMDFEDAYECFSEQIRAVLEADADILHFETFTDLSELRVAVIAAKKLSPGTPVIATLSFEKNGKTMMGDGADSAMAALASLGVDCAGANCGLSPSEMLPIFGKLSGFGIPLCSKPNAGAPVMENGVPQYKATIEEYRDTAFGFAELGARLLGGCCGSGPAHIAKMREAVDAINARGGEKTFIGGRKRAILASPDRIASIAARARASAGVNVSFAAGCPIVELSDLVGSALGAGDLEAEIIDRLLSAEESDGADGKCGTDGTDGADGKGGADGADGAVVAYGADGKGGAGGCAAVISLLSSGAAAAAAPVAAANPAAAEDGGRAARMADILRVAAVNARIYLKRPAIFRTDAAGALDAALSRYCGLAGVELEAAGASAAEMRAVAGRYGAQLV
jgi:5-methyltetrahydrofolate--homocysteine methyltransferase